MNLKTYTPVDPKFIFEKNKFEVLHYIHYYFAWQPQGSVRIWLACSKILNYFDHRFWNTFPNTLWQQIFIFHKCRCGKCSQEKNTTIPLNPCRGEIVSFYNPSTSQITELTISLFNIFVNFTKFLFGLYYLDSKYAFCNISRSIF